VTTAGVVLLAYHFPPDPAVGSLRAAKVARAFREAGYGVEVVTAQLPGETGARASDDSGLRIHPVTPLPPPREVLVRLKAWLRASRRQKPDDAGPAPTPGWAPEAYVAGWKRLLSSLLWLPDDRQGFVIPAWRTARRLVRGGARLVYSTAPPYSPHLVGLALRSRRGVRWIMELRDPWADNDQKPWWVRTRVTDAIDARLERYCLERADLVVTVSEGIRARLLARMPAFDQSRLVVVRNGIERLAPATRFGHRSGPVRITYVGTFYYSRDPRPFLRGLAAVLRAHGLGPDQIRVDFTGACRSVGAVSVQAEIDALGLTDVVHIHDWLPHAAAGRLVEESDVLLLLAQQQPDQVPNKLYEYLGARRPILAFADADGETERMLRRVGGHRVVTKDDQVEVERALEDVLAWARHGAPDGVDSALLQEWTTESQMKRLLVAVGG